MQTTVEVPAPSAGVITALLVKDGDKVLAKQLLYKLNVGATSAAGGAPPAAAKPAAAAAAPAAAAKPAAAKPPPPSASVAGPAPTRAPAAPRPPTAPLSSTSAGDLRPATGAHQPVLSAAGGAVPIPTGVAADRAISGARQETRVKTNRMRQRIAQRLKDAQNTNAMLTTFNEIDMT